MQVSRHYPGPTRSLAGLHLRLARLADLPEMVAFCLTHATLGPDARPPDELTALLLAHMSTTLLAWRNSALVGVALCGVTRSHARLLELLVEPGPDRPAVERRLIRRCLWNLRAWDVTCLEFCESGANSEVDRSLAAAIRNS